MAFLAAVGGLLILLVLYDTFHTIVMPGTVNRRTSLTTFYYGWLWRLARPILSRFKVGSERREWLLGVFGPASLLGLIIVWAVLLITGFGLLQFGLETPLSNPAEVSFGSHMYMSATTFFTLGYGDVTAQNPTGRVFAVMEAGIGFGLLAVVISYIPVLYQAFSRREATTVLMDARAGSPPTASGLLERHSDEAAAEGLLDILKEFERWSGQLLETYLSYPVLCTYRSQHEALSWLACLTCILDTTAWLQTAVPDEGMCRQLRRQAEFTYAMARHLAVDLAYIAAFPPAEPQQDRLPPADYELLVAKLSGLGLPVDRSPEAYAKLCAMRREYEPYLQGLGDALLLNIPGWLHPDDARDSWQTTAWDAGRHF